MPKVKTVEVEIRRDATHVVHKVVPVYEARALKEVFEVRELGEGKPHEVESVDAEVERVCRIRGYDEDGNPVVAAERAFGTRDAIAEAVQKAIVKAKK